MQKLILLMLLSISSYCLILNTNLTQKNIELLTNLDIETSFLQDKGFKQVYKYMHKGALFQRTIDKFEDGYAFIPLLIDMMRKEDIPLEFLYLALAESEFSLRAYSKKRAAGIWQIMPATGRMYGLKINEYVDERREPIKSTQAAIMYLKDLHAQFGKWYLAMIAYNCGPGRLKKAIRQAKTDNLQALLNIKKTRKVLRARSYLPQETRTYIRKIVSYAILLNDIHMMSNLNKDYFLNRGAIRPIVEISVKGGTHLQHIASNIGVSLKELQQYNKHLRYSFTPPNEEQYSIYIPYSNLMLLRDNFDKIQQIHNKNIFMVYRVKKGDTLSQIAQKYKISWRAIKSINNLKSNMLRIKQKLIIPLPKEI